MNDQPRQDVQAPPVGTAFLVSQVGAHAAIRFAEMLAPLDLTPQDAGILRMLGSNPGLTQYALSQLLGMFPSRLVLLLDNLERRHCIERRPSPNDRRAYHLHLTREGKKSLTAIGRITNRLEKQLFAALQAQEVESLCGALQRVVRQQGITPGVHPAYRQASGRPRARS